MYHGSPGRSNWASLSEPHHRSAETNSAVVPHEHVVPEVVVELSLLVFVADEPIERKRQDKDWIGKHVTHSEA